MTRRSKATSIAERPAAAAAPRYRFVGGKGGVGKTTCAAAMGLRCAARGLRTLVISTDPAPSLGDAFGRRLGRTPRPVAGQRRLDAAEINAAAALDRWIGARRNMLEEIAFRGTWLDRDDVSRLLRLSLPGIDEVAALLQIAELDLADRYERIIVDAAPTGHMLRMLDMPAVLHGVSAVFDHMQMKHRIMVDALRGGWTRDAADLLIDEIRGDAGRINSLLRDSSRTRLSWVTLPERMSVEETADAVRWLREHGLTVDAVIVNQVTAPPPGPCRWCAGRRASQRQAIGLLRRMTGAAARVIPVPAADREPRGVRALADIGRLLDRGPQAAVAGVPRAPAPVTAALPAGGNPIQPGDLAGSQTRLLMFGGKGGVGKTTCAAAVALHLARQSPALRVLLLSADPAHSIGDALGETFTDLPRPPGGGPGNLVVRELNAGRVYDELRERFARAIDDLFARMTGAGTIERSVAAGDRQVIRDLMDLAPPGLDEIAAILEVTEALIEGQRESGYDLVVMDTAPTGHALRLIEMPSLVHQWVKAVMAILLKYQPVVRLGDLGALLLQLSRGLGGLRTLMSDPARTRFIAVTRPAALPRAETLRLLRRLRMARVDAPFVIVNAVGAGTCARCRTQAAAQVREIGGLRRGLSSARQKAGRRLILTPAVTPPPHGAAGLRAWVAAWRQARTGGSR